MGLNKEEIEKCGKKFPQSQKNYNTNPIHGKMKFDRNTLTLVLFLLLVITVTNYTKPGASDYLGIASTVILTIALVINLVSLWKKGRDEK